MIEIKKTLQRLGDQTSRNLAKAYELYPTVRLGEEAITEHNLLAIATAHTKEVEMQSFGKKKEAENGADWEWVIIGDKTRSELRVQAKRVSKDGFVRNLDYHNQSGSQLEKLLQTPGFLPIICFYASDDHRTKWTIENDLELGCLFAKAEDIRERLHGLGKGPKTKFSTYEDLCHPWHHFLDMAQADQGKESIVRQPPKDDGRSTSIDLVFPTGPPNGTLGFMMQTSSRLITEARALQLETFKRMKLEQGVIGRITIDLSDPDHSQSR